MTDTRRDRNGRFVKTCRDCDTKAQWYIEGYGAFGLYGTGRSRTFCKKHGRAAVNRMNGHDLGRSSYHLVNYETSRVA